MAKGPGVVERVAKGVWKGVRAVGKWLSESDVLVPVLTPFVIGGVVISIIAFFVVRHDRFKDGVRLRCLSEGLDSETDGMNDPKYLNTGREVFAICLDADKKRVLRRVP